MSGEMTDQDIFVLLGKLGWEPRKTEMIGNGIGVDPPGCGCTDCMVGNSFPEDQLDPNEVLAAVALGRPIYDRR